MKSNPLVSVVIPTIPTRKKELKRALDSVKNQTYKNIEIVVVDEGLPAPVQRNIGIKRSHGDFIAFLDDDDVWRPNTIKKKISFISQNPQYHFLINWTLDKKGSYNLTIKPSPVITHIDFVKGVYPGPTSSFFVKRGFLKKLEDIDGFIFDESLPSGQDYDLLQRFSKYFGDVYCLQEVLTILNKTPGQITYNWGSKIRGHFCFLNKYSSEYSLMVCFKHLCLIFIYFMGFFVGHSVMERIKILRAKYRKIK